METTTLIRGNALHDPAVHRLQALAMEAGWLALELENEIEAATCEAFAASILEQLLTSERSSPPARRAHDDATTPVVDAPRLAAAAALR